MPTNPPTRLGAASWRLFASPLTPIVIVALIGAALWAHQAGMF